MRNKEVFERRLERLEVEVKSIGYHIRRNEQDVAFDLVGRVLEKLQDLQTLLNTEEQD